MSSRVMVLAAMVFFPWAGLARADESKAPGSALTLREAVSKSDVIFIGDVRTTGFLGGQNNLMGASVEFHEGVRGCEAIDTRHGMVIISLAVSFTLDSKTHEKEPRSGESYIVCGVNSPRSDFPCAAVKIFPSTPARIAEIKKLAAELPKK